MTANLLTLNSAKTEFLLIGLQQQLAKIHNFSLNTTHSASFQLSLFPSVLVFLSKVSYLSHNRLFLDFYFFYTFLVPLKPFLVFLVYVLD